MRKWLPLFLLFPVILFLSACATIPVFPPETPAPDFLLEQIKTRVQTLAGLKGLAQVKLATSNKSFSTPEILFVRRPAMLRAESLSPLGLPHFYLVTDGRELSIYHAGENRYYRGRPTASRLAVVLPFKLEVEEVVSLLLGTPLLIEYEMATIRRAPDEALWIMELVSPSRGERQIFWVHPYSFNVLRVELHRSSLAYRLIFAEFRRFQGDLFPQKIQYTSFEPPMQLTVEYNDLTLNPPFGPQDFNLPVPAGAKIFPLD